MIRLQVFLVLMGITLFVKAQTVLIIGANPNVLTELSTELQQRGFSVESSDSYKDETLIEQNYAGKKFDVVAFGRALTVESKTDLQTFFQQANPGVAFVDGLAPITNLLADQVELAANQSPQNMDLKMVQKRTLELHIPETAAIKITFYQLNWMYRSYEKVVSDREFAAGGWQILLPKKSGQRFVSVRFNNKVVAVQKI